MKEKIPFDFERFKSEAMQGLCDGNRLSPYDGVLAPLMKHLLESIIDGELANHLREDKASGIPNRRNGKTKKMVRGVNTGTFELESGRDRFGTFEPKVFPKRQLIITEQLEGHVLSMYAKGMGMRAISDFIHEIYAMEISTTEISHLTELIIPAVNEWQNRPLEAVYPFVFLDCMHYKVRQKGTVESRAIYTILGIGTDGRKDLIGLYSSKNQGSKFWLSVLTDLKKRGVADILIACIDGLKGFPKAIEAIFPKTKVQYYSANQIKCALGDRKG